MIAELVIIFALVVVNGVLAGAEIAVIAVRSSRLKELVDQGSGAARAVQALRGDPERFLATVQIGITVIGATAGAFGGITLAEDLAPVLAAWPLLAPVSLELAVGITVTLVSYLSLVVGELVPKSLALKAAESYALAVGRPLLLLASAARPLVWLLTASSNALLRPFRDRTSFIEARMSSDELRELVGDAARSGAVNRQAGEIAVRALELPELVAGDVMVPRTRVVALRRGATRDEVRRLLLEHTHSRFPVIDRDLDHVVGYLAVKDVLSMAWDEHLFVLEDLIRPAWFVPTGKRAVELLTEMRTRRMPFVVVVDERGGMAGLVTLEDLLEELVGEILSERTRESPPVTREADGSYTVAGEATIRAVNRELGVTLPEGEWHTVAGLCLALAGRIPAPGERLTVGGFTVEVLDAAAQQVRTVRLRVAGAPRLEAPPASPRG